MFRFKQFTIDQSGCAMKINTDGVLLGAIAAADGAGDILDVGTGTGVIALMLAQRFTYAKIEAIEIDEVAAQTAERNFKCSPFADRLEVFSMDFENYFNRFSDKKYDLIVSNPPFYIDSLKSPGAKKALAKHTDADFFERLMKGIAGHLMPGGLGWLIVPAGIAERVVALAAGSNIFLRKTISVHSYARSPAHRMILCFGFDKSVEQISELTIYEAPDIYTGEYKKLLQPFFLAF